MTEKIICAGFGGQGIMLMGQLLARLGLKHGYQVSWLPSYGAEVRGGTAYCYVIISDKEISSPYIQNADTCIIMNEPSLIKFQKRIEKKGLLLLNSSLTEKTPARDDIQLYKIPFTEIAIKLGNVKIANSVALGAYLALKKLFSQNDLFRIIEEVAPKGKKELIQINKEAVSQGIKEAQR